MHTFFLSEVCHKLHVFGSCITFYFGDDENTLFLSHTIEFHQFISLGTKWNMTWL